MVEQPEREGCPCSREERSELMRRAILLLTTMALALVAAGGTALAFNCGAGSCWGTPHGDRMIGTPADEGRHGRGGADLIRGLGGNDFLTGDAGGDAVFGGPGKDAVEGNRGDDKVEGGRGSDKVNGGEGADRVVGNKGNDRLHGGAGRDHLDGQDLGPAGIGGSDVLDCGPGRDTYEADFDDTVMRNCEKGVVGGS
jgi:Ca2+-binding RTX toxin-like protein